MAKGKQNTIFQLRIDLLDTPVWRCIQVPSTYTFWDLHVAIQDSMGWLDYHLHEFTIRLPRKRKDTIIGIPDPVFETDVTPGWEMSIAEHLTEPGKTAEYLYDFGDSWEHQILLEGILLKQVGTTYPRCISGKHACPPEDCGGIPGYERLVSIVRNPKHPEYKQYADWLGNQHAKCYWPYKPDEFNPESIEFWDPKKRFKMAFS